ncbi:MAG: hypothetical protein HYW49_05265 [Deltaproteobacteria bacterium]|nr:hypothetical protein [Deltaproteobacteria bacterium]
MKLSDIVRAVNSDERLVLAALEALKTDTFVENRGLFQQERTFGITGLGVRFIRNMPQDNFG